MRFPQPLDLRAGDGARDGAGDGAGNGMPRCGLARSRLMASSQSASRVVARTSLLQAPDYIFALLARSTHMRCSSLPPSAPSAPSPALPGPFVALLTPSARLSSAQHPPRPSHPTHTQGDASHPHRNIRTERARHAIRSRAGGGAGVHGERPDDGGVAGQVRGGVALRVSRAGRGDLRDGALHDPLSLGAARSRAGARGRRAKG